MKSKALWLTVENLIGDASPELFGRMEDQCHIETALLPLPNVYHGSKTPPAIWCLLFENSPLEMNGSNIERL